MADDGSVPFLAVVALADGAEGEVLSALQDRVDWEELATTDVDGRVEFMKCDAGSTQPPRLGVPVVAVGSAHAMVVCVGAAFAVLSVVVSCGVKAVFFF